MTDTYDIGGVLPAGFRQTLPAGTNLAIVGPTIVGRRELALRLLAAGNQTGDGILCITTESATSVHADLERHIDALDRNRVGILDASGSDTPEAVRREHRERPLTERSDGDQHRHVETVHST